jgi:hypothetical protein
VPKLIIQPLTPERWPDLEAIFTAKGDSIAVASLAMAGSASVASVASTASAA